MSYAEDFNHDLDSEFLGLCHHFGSDFDSDTTRIHYIWVCENGTEMPIEKMRTIHIKRCIRLIKKSVNEDRPWRIEFLKPLLAELNKRAFLGRLNNMSKEELIEKVLELSKQLQNE